MHAKECRMANLVRKTGSEVQESFLQPYTMTTQEQGGSKFWLQWWQKTQEEKEGAKAFRFWMGLFCLNPFSHSLEKKTLKQRSLFLNGSYWKGSFPFFHTEARIFTSSRTFSKAEWRQILAVCACRSSVLLVWHRILWLKSHVSSSEDGWEQRPGQGPHHPWLRCKFVIFFSYCHDKKYLHCSNFWFNLCLLLQFVLADFC